MYIFITLTKGSGRIGGLLQYTDTEFSKGTLFSKISPLRQCCNIAEQLLHNKKVEKPVTENLPVEQVFP